MRSPACKAASGKSICAFPDVCFTPPQTPATPPGVPIPYPNTGMASDTTDGSTSVKVSGQEVMLKNKSYFKKSTGDEAGSAPKKGVISSKNTGKVYFSMWSMDVKCEGENVVRHLDTLFTPSGPDERQRFLAVHGLRAGGYTAFRGFEAKDMVRTELIAQNITTPDDASIPGVLVDDVATARSMALSHSPCW